MDQLKGDAEPVVRLRVLFLVAPYGPVRNAYLRDQSTSNREAVRTIAWSSVTHAPTRYGPEAVKSAATAIDEITGATVKLQ